MTNLPDDDSLSPEERALLDELVRAIAEASRERREERIRAYTHLVKVGAVKPDTDHLVDVWAPRDPTYAHFLLEPDDYMEFLLMGYIEFDTATGYPIYTGPVPPR